MIPLTRNLHVIDVETTGKSVTLDRIVSVASLTVRPDGTEDLWSSLVNPGRPIPHEATYGTPDGKYTGHGITDDMVKDAPSFAALAPDLSLRWAGGDVAGYNLKRFDLPMLTESFLREHVPCPFTEDTKVLDAARLWQLLEPRTLADAWTRWCGKQNPMGLHDAVTDVYVTRDVLREQIRHGLSTQADWARGGDALAATLHDLQWPWPEGALDPDGKIVFVDGAARWTFGKYNGIPLTQTPPKYFYWVTDDKQDFSPQVKALCQRFLAGETLGPRVVAE